MNITGLILARSGSKGIPDKNIKLLNGKPLMSYAIRAALGSSLKEVYVSSDSQKYLDLAESYGAKTILRPPELAQDDSKSIDAVKHSIESLEHPEANGIEAICLINACCPLTTSQDIDGAVKMMRDTSCSSVVSLVEDFSCHWSKTCQLDKENRIISEQQFKTGARQNLTWYKRNTAIYLATRELLMMGQFFADDTRGYVMPKERSLDLNDAYDWLIAELLMKHYETIA